MDDRFQINLSNPTPIYAQLEQSIRFAIATERLRVGEQLPTVRQLAVELKINANTVARVYADLERAGILETRRGVGTFVRVRDFSPLRNRGGLREKNLSAFVRRLVGEAQALGFSVDELLDHLAEERAKGDSNGR
jgi:GntR family transcriptional regulator